MHDPDPAAAPRRHIRSFVRREGRLTPAQQQALATLLPRYGLPEQPSTTLDCNAIFGNRHPLLLEIGYGNGASLLAQAESNPQQNHIGLEVHRPGAGHLLQEIERRQLHNVRIAIADAASWLPKAIASASIDTVQVFFPDPWHKKRHNKRRLIQTAFVDELARIIVPAGRLMLATDWQDYAEHMLAVMTAHPVFSNAAGAGRFSPRPDCRPLTRFEQRGQRLGHDVFDLQFLRHTS
ncbi:MAG: tRNA (guanosine(46)-N7)-methyltransferase TrmB [Wenzhouxiangellaceae bacterium]